MGGLITFGYIPEEVHAAGGDVVWTITLIMAVLGLYVMIQKLWPLGASHVRKAIGFVWRWVILLLPRALWALWRQLCRDEHGVSRGPLTRFAEFITRRFVELVEGATAPQFADVAARSTRQHDEQNEAIAALSTAVHTGFERGSLRMDDMTKRIDALETRTEANLRTEDIVAAVHESTPDKENPA